MHPFRIHWAATVAACALHACGGDSGSTSGPSNSSSASSSCGQAGTLQGEECTGLLDCGAGELNIRRVAFCDNCPFAAETEACFSGVCTPITAQGRIDVGQTVLPDEAVGAQSVIVAAYELLAADGTQVTCEGLISPECSLVGTTNLNASNARFINLPGPHEVGLVYPGFSTASEPGDGRLLVMLATTMVQGNGEILAAGCAPVNVASSGRTTVDSLTLSPR